MPGLADTIVFLDLGGCRSDDSNVVMLTAGGHLVRCESLQHLDLRDCGLNSEGPGGDDRY